MRHSQSTKDEAFGMYAEGLSVAEIGRRLGISKSTIHTWLSPTGQAYVQRAKEDPERKERQRVYDQTPERKEYRKAYTKAYHEDPRNKERQKAYRQTAKYKKYSKAYRQNPKNREREKARRQTPEARKRQSERIKERRINDPTFRVLARLRTRAHNALRGASKSAKTEELLGIPGPELARQWDKEYGPNWQSSRDLHIDHVRPCSSFNLTDPDQQLLCFNYRNLQLLPATRNTSKRDSWTPEMESAWAARMRDLGWNGELFLAFGPATMDGVEG